jgi:tetratricopeptide (TPR) repeat protein
MGARGDEAGLALLDASRSRWLRTTLCVPAGSLAASRAALERIEGARLAAPEARLLALASAAWSESVAGDPSAVPGIVSAVRAMPEAMGDRGLEAELELARGTALMRAGDHAAAGRACEGAAELARLAGRPDLAALSLLTAASAATCAGDIAHVVHLADRLDNWPWPGVSLEAQMRAARAHALSRLGEHDAARDAAAANLRRAEGGSERDRALAALDMGEVLLASGPAGAPDAARHLRAALDVPEGGIPRALARLRLAEALAAAGDIAGAEAELEQVPFEPAGPADMPEALVPRIAGVQAAIAAARGDRTLAGRRLDEAVAGWTRLAVGAPTGDAYAAVLVDLGRPPVAGLVEPERERQAALATRAALGEGEPVP